MVTDEYADYQPRVPQLLPGLSVRRQRDWLRTTAGWLTLFPGILWVISDGAVQLGGILALVAGSRQPDPAGSLVTGGVEGLLAALYLVIFWAAVLRDRGSGTSSPSRSAVA